ncbi:MAG: T9SS type A sorting domain-containing protein [Bacteroidales bacterium]
MYQDRVFNVLINRKFIVLFFIGVVYSSFSYSQNSFQKVILSDSIGFFGMRIKSDSGVVLGIQSQPAFRLITLDKYGQAISAHKITDSISLMMQGILPLSDGGMLLTGMANGWYPFVIKVNAYNEFVWARYSEVGFGFDFGFYYDAAEDQSGTLLLLEQKGNMGRITALDPSGQFLWKKETDLVNVFTRIKSTSSGGFFLAGINTDGAYLWEMSPDGIVSQCTSIQQNTTMLQIQDIIELPDNQLILLFQFQIGNVFQFALTKLDASRNVLWNRSYSYYKGFRQLGNLHINSQGNLILVGNVNNPEDIGGFYPPYQVFRAEFSFNGDLVSAYRYHGGSQITGVSQSIYSPDNGTLICGYACDSMSYPYFPYLIKTDEIAMTPCFMDTVNLSTQTVIFIIQDIDNQFTNLNDSIIPLYLNLQETEPGPVLTLCFTGISAVEKMTLSVFPNPVNETLSLNYNNTTSPPMEVEIFSITGCLVLKTGLKAENGSGAIDVSGLQSGSYLLKLVTTEKQFFIKFVKI